ncbi:hypothetical protein SKAU_G00318720 [Synaphobranchus kaupii]|uniref:Uncharacterized protein n=1 Tax=Synaphobranchus kaupii TaxID=118154 RepID=A0A9Q1ET34_SYNKA|nr:hypothetical protein SKAU_G00318720 [Synaphobranchus kaupii]
MTRHPDRGNLCGRTEALRPTRHRAESGRGLRIRFTAVTQFSNAGGKKKKKRKDEEERSGRKETSKDEAEFPAPSPGGGEKFPHEAKDTAKYNIIQDRLQQPHLHSQGTEGALEKD